MTTLATRGSPVKGSAAILVNRHCSSTATTDFSREKWLADSDYDANPAINVATVHTLARCEWIEKGEPCTGKTHLLIGLGTDAAQDGFRVRYTLATKLVNELFEAADERQLAKTIARYGRVDLLCIDELGYMQLYRRGAEMPFHVLTEREETASVAIASNEASPAGPKPSPTRGCAPRSSTV